MKSNEKLMIAILVIITLCLVIFAASRGKKEDVVENNPTTIGNKPNITVEEDYVQTTESGTKVNTSEKLAEKKVVNNIEFTDIQLTEKNGQTLLIATVTNTSDTKSEMFEVRVTLLDENGGEIKTIPGLVAPLEPGASTQFSSSTTLDFANAYDFTVTAK